MKKYIKKKDPEKHPNQPGPGYATSKYFRGKTFGGKRISAVGHNPAQFKVQHKG